jgi:DNA-binding GntR family transcriptional regulator
MVLTDLFDSQTPIEQPVSERTYVRLRDMAMTFAFRPCERLNETALAAKLKVSRTPLREAMHRLAAEGLLVQTAGRGFSARPFDVKELSDLYEMRLALELTSVRLACERVTEGDLEAMGAYLDQSVAAQSTAPVKDLLRYDEGFHERVAAASGNGELLRMMRALNRHIHFFRWIDMEGRRDATQADHRAILRAIANRDAEAGIAIMRPHIERRLDQIVDGIREGHARLWTGAGLANTNQEQKS